MQMQLLPTLDDAGVSYVARETTATRFRSPKLANASGPQTPTSMRDLRALTSPSPSSSAPSIVMTSARRNRLAEAGKGAPAGRRYQRRTDEDPAA